MSTRFTGTFEELKQLLACISHDGEWREINNNQKQFRHKNGSVLNWYPTTGTVNFQGRSEAKSVLESAVNSAIRVVSASPLTSNTSGFHAPALPEVNQTTQPAKNADSQAPEQPTSKRTSPQDLLGQRFSDSELVFGFVGAVGTDLDAVSKLLEERLKVFKYDIRHVRVSQDVIPLLVQCPGQHASEFARISSFMDAGNEARRLCGDNSILALGVAAKISAVRGAGEQSLEPKLSPRRAVLVNSLKHPDEVVRLREIYPQGFYLIGVHADPKRRHRCLTEERRIGADDADRLMDRDEDEHVRHGQRTSDTFHLSDFFVRLDENNDKLKHSVWRILDILFGSPHKTPTFDEYAMFMAFSASLRSADLSRQVGAVIAKQNEIIATGANDCPRLGGGLYWPEYDEATSSIVDADDGRDYMRGIDSNRSEQLKIIESILSALGDTTADREKLRTTLMESGIKDITEYGRVVHAEMESLLSCARNHVSTRNATLYCTTFPCHNCAKHIIAAGITRVVYVEPYPKSKALEFHTDSVKLGFSDDDDGSQLVCFEPFVGVGPRRFFDLFSMRLGSGYPLKRKDDQGQSTEWTPEASKLRTQMLPGSYLELETLASTMFNAMIPRKESNNGSR